VGATDYDWHDPKRVVMTTTDSNVWGGRSGHTYTLTQKPDGTTDVDAVVIREGKGRVLGFVLGTVGKGRLEKAFGNSVKAINPETQGDPDARAIGPLIGAGQTAGA
jgi:hypothetical protein